MPGWPELDQLRNATGRPYAVELAAEPDPGGGEPASVIAAYAAGSRPIVLWGTWLDSEVIIAVDPLVELAGLDAADCWDPLRLRPHLDGALPDGLGGGWFAALGYDPGTSWLAFCDAVLRRRSDGSWVFETLGLEGRRRATAAALARARSALSGVRGHPTDGAGESAVGPLSPVVDAADHLAGVDRVIGRIRAGDVYQLNLCTRLTGELRSDPLALFVRTAGAVRPSYGAHLPTGETTTLVSLSPERFLSVHGREVVTSPIKGTTSRNEDPDGSRLRSSAKDVAENIMITDLMRNDLSRVCAPGSVVVTGLLELRAHPGVWHLVSTVRGDLEPALTVADLLAATYPPGSVTGAPKSSALRAIAAEEPYARGAYTGAAGMVTVDDRADFSVLIRTFETAGDTVQLGVGGGITVDSVPVLEWHECLHKAEPLAVSAGSRLTVGIDDRPARVPEIIAAGGVFESILVQHGQVLRLADHLARLARSVRELYGTSLPEDLAARVRAAGATQGGGRAVVRVGVRPSEQGSRLTVTANSLGPRLASCRLVRATRLEGSWRHKWHVRSELEATEQTAAPALPYFLDPQGRVAETSRGNLFVRGADGVWRTPPTSEHLLPGVTRRALLDELADRGVAVEIAAVAGRDLATVRSVVWTSSLSGVVQVSACDGRALETDGEPARWSRWLGMD